MSDLHTKVLIIGSGPAGYTAAIYAARANLKPILVTGMTPGGQLTITTDVENYPGFGEVIQGPWLMSQMEQQSKNVGVDIQNDHIKDVDFADRPFVAIGESGKKYTADTIVISTGAQARWLGLESEKKFQGFGVSGCATCDGFFYKNKDVAVIGGGNTAVEEAIYLTNFANKVTLIHRRDSFRAEQILQERMFANKKIEVIWDSVLEEIVGTENPLSVNGLIINNLQDNKTRELKVDGVFIAIGHVPNTSLFKGKLKLDDENYIITSPNSTKTSIEGVFAAGDVQDKIYRQAVTAAGTGCMAALEAEKYIATMKSNKDLVK
jgi:thioredoxin reductase (NADPH)